MDSAFNAYIGKDCRVLGKQLLVFNDFYMTAVVKKTKYMLKTFLKFMNFLTNLRQQKILVLCLYLYI